jgi:site-specific DNA recombinase
LEGLKGKDTELRALFKQLYEDNFLGKIPNEALRKLSDDCLLEQKEIQSSIPIKKERLEKIKDSVTNVGAFLKKAKHCT